LPFRLEFLQRLRAADAHFFFVGFETFNDAAAAWRDAFTKPLNVAHAIGSKVLHFLRFAGGYEQAGGNEAGGQKANQHTVLLTCPADVDGAPENSIDATEQLTFFSGQV
jgi:hypothetical protein